MSGFVFAYIFLHKLHSRASTGTPEGIVRPECINIFSAMRFCVILLGVLTAAAADYKIGVGRVDITPSGPIWLSGYAARTKPSEGVLQRIWAKALAIEDRKGGRLLIVTTDLVGLPRSVTDVVSARLAKEHDLQRERIGLGSAGSLEVRPRLASSFSLRRR